MIYVREIFLSSTMQEKLRDPLVSVMIEPVKIVKENCTRLNFLLQLLVRFERFLFESRLSRIDRKLLFQSRADKRLQSIPIPVLGIEATSIPIPSQISQFHQFRKKNQGNELPASLCSFSAMTV